MVITVSFQCLYLDTDFMTIYRFLKKCTSPYFLVSQEDQATPNYLLVHNRVNTQKEREQKPLWNKNSGKAKP